MGARDRQLTPDAHGGEHSERVIATLVVPASFEPAAARGWVVDATLCPPWAIVMAIGPALILDTS